MMRNTSRSIPQDIEPRGWTKISADRLDIIRDILLVAAHDIGKSRREFEEDIRQLVTPPSSRISKSPSWKDRVILEYIRAGQVLGLWDFDEPSQLRLAERFHKQMHTIISEDNAGEELSLSEQYAFRSILLEHQHVAKFLSWFMIDNRHPISTEDFINNSTSIALAEVTPISSRPKGPDVYIKSGQSFPIEKPYIRITWVNVSWCKAVGLIDEIRVIPTGICSEEESHKLYPVKIDGSPGRELSLQGLVSMIIATYQIKPDEIKRMQIPKLIYDMCTNHFIGIRYFKECLVLAYKRFRNNFYLEQISSIFVDSRRRRFNLTNNYVRVGGFYRGYVLINGEIGGPNEREF